VNKGFKLIVDIFQGKCHQSLSHYFITAVLFRIAYNVSTYAHKFYSCILIYGFFNSFISPVLNISSVRTSVYTAGEWTYVLVCHALSEDVSSAVSNLTNKAGCIISGGSKQSAKYTLQNLSLVKINWPLVLNLWVYVLLTLVCPSYNFDVMTLRLLRLPNLQASVVTCQLSKAL